MPIRTYFITALSTLLIAATLVTPSPAASEAKINPPDFTKRKAIPAVAQHGWNLGATGARGWMFYDAMVTAGAHQFAITKNEKKSPR